LPLHITTCPEICKPVKELAGIKQSFKGGKAIKRLQGKNELDSRRKRFCLSEWPDMDVRDNVKCRYNFFQSMSSVRFDAGSIRRSGGVFPEIS